MISTPFDTSKLNLKDILFLFLFSMAFFSYLLIGNTLFGFVIIIVFFFLQLVFLGKNEMSSLLRQKSLRVLFGLWLLYLGFNIVSTFFSHSLPLSMTALTFTFFVCAFFWITLSSTWIRQNSHLILFSVVIEAVILSMIAGFLLFFPEFGKLLPGMNLVYSTFGHSHIAAILVLVLPITYYYAAVSHKKSFLFLSAFLLLGLITSFGRTATVVSLGQALVFGTWYYKNFRFKKEFSQMLLGFFIVVTIILSMLVVLKMLVSLSPQASWSQKICGQASLSKKLCKDFYTEPRPYYWQQAIKATQTFPLTGYGLGTFSLVNEKWRQSNSYSTDFAHNAYLEHFAETGILGGMTMSLLILYLLFLGVRGLRAEQDMAKKMKQVALLLAVSGMSLNVMLDFDWSFRGVFLLTFLIFALLLGDIPSRHREDFESNHQLRMIPILLAGFPAFLALFFMVSAVMTAQGKIMHLFLLFQDNPESVIKKVPQLQPSEKMMLLTIYEFHPQLYSQLLIQAESPLEKFKYSQKLIETSPWKGVSVSQAQKLMESGYYTEAEQDIDSQLRMLEKGNSIGVKPFSYHDLSIFADTVIRLADHNYLSGEAEKSGKYYYQAFTLDPWSLGRNPPVFMTNLDPQLLYSFLPQVREIDTKYLNDYRSNYAQAFVSLAKYKILEKPGEDFVNDSLTAASIEPSRYWQIKDDLLPLVVFEAQRKFDNDDNITAQSLVDQANLLLARVKSNDDTNQEFYYEYELANLNVLVGNWQMKAGQADQMGKYYIQAQTLDPTVLTESNAAIKIWLEEQDWRDKRLEELIAYTEVLASLNIDEIRAKEEQVRMMQFVASQLAKTEQRSKVEAILEQMIKLVPTSYWVVVQRGNWYLASNEISRANSAFRECLDMFPTHRDCQIGLEGVESSDFNNQRFFEVSQIILGEKNYTDFE